MNAPHAAIDLLDRRHHTTWAPAMVSGQATHRRPISSIDDGRHVDAPIGTSHAWREVIRRATQVAATETTTCLQGESGTGKEVIARFIHQRSPRRRGPFIAINCAALPEQLLESELFGFERGAFTGAQQSKPGQIELAAGGVLFLDEVTEMTPAAQAKFLRVLQEREFLRLGGTRPVRVNVRVIAATNRNLDDAVAQRAIPCRPLLPFERLRHSHSAAARAARRHSAARGWLSPRVRWRHGGIDARGDGGIAPSRMARQCP